MLNLYEALFIQKDRIVNSLGSIDYETNSEGDIIDAIFIECTESVKHYPKWAYSGRRLRFCNDGLYEELKYKPDEEPYEYSSLGNLLKEVKKC